MNALRVVAWETTRRCALACRHCRGSARDVAETGELTTAEGLRLLDSLARVSTPLLILTGGEPMMRADIYDLARHASDRGLRVVMAPCGHLLTPETVSRLIASSVSAISISLDAADAAGHDAFRGAAGAFDASLRGLRCAHRAGLPFQINTTVTRLNVDHLPALLELAEREGATALDLFFLVPTGRGRSLADLQADAKRTETVLNWAAEMDASRPLRVRTTCAPQMARVRATRGVLPSGRLGGPTGGCMAGRGFLFVSHAGILQPCGFLDLPCGNLRTADFDVRALLAASDALRSLGSPEGMHGKCGRCEYRGMCGGCRARAYACTGDVLGPDPICGHVPGGKAVFA